MNDHYEMRGCIDFGTSEVAISIPVLMEKSSNKIFIPKTDQQFIVLDFYEMEELGYDVYWFKRQQEVTVQIGKKCPVPIYDGLRAYIVDPDADATAIRQSHPGLAESAIKAFVSLRDRLKQVPRGGEGRAEYEHIFPNELLSPVRSKYWISRFNAVIRSSQMQNRLDSKAIADATTIRDSWIEKFAVKAPFGMVAGILDIDELPMSQADKDRILLKRFDNLFRSKGFNLPNSEIAHYEARFPKGILNAATMLEDGGPSYGAWEMQDHYSRVIYLHGENIKNRRSPGTGDTLWCISMLEITRIHRIIKLLVVNDFTFGNALNVLTELEAISANRLREVVESIERQTRGRQSADLFRTVLEMFGLSFGHAFGEGGKFIPTERFFDMLLEYYRKLIILRQIVDPNLRTLPTSQIGIEGVDEGAITHLRKFYARRERTKLFESVDWKFD